MVVVRIPDKGVKIDDSALAREYLSSIGIDYEVWDTKKNPDAGAPADKILQAYSNDIDKLKRDGGYTTADVIDINSSTPGLDSMLAKFNKEHLHKEDEVRFTISGHGIFHIHPENSDVVAIEVSAGDLLRVPRGTHHWFDLCEDRNIRAIRLFQDISGWTPYYVTNGVDKNYQPMCFGPAYIKTDKKRN